MSDKDPLAQAIGLEGFATKTSGIGGVLKARVSDFRVDEISSSIKLDNKGRFTVAKVTLTNWETNRFCTNLARELKIPRNRIFFAGTKDKRAVTSQLFVIDAPEKKVTDLVIPDVLIQVLGRTHQKIDLGNHKGNRFTIVVRGCSNPDGSPMSEKDALGEIEIIKNEMAQNIGPDLFPNWIGPQRFGSGRPVTAEVGKYVVTEHWKEAVMAYLSMPGFNESPEVAAFRENIRTNGPNAEALIDMPKWLGFERNMLEHIVKYPEDWVGSFKKLPTNLQLMTVHAIQSVIFNKSLNGRIKAGLPISLPIAGDLVGRIDEKGQLNANSCVIIEQRTLPRITRNCQLGRLTPTGPLPGSIVKTCQGEAGKIEMAAIEEMNLQDISWNVEAVSRLSSKGTRRALVTGYSEFSIDTVPIGSDDTMGEKWKAGPGENSRWHPEGACIRFRFTLSSGSYATTLLREFMQCPLSQI